MTRPMVLVCVIVALSGCRSPAPRIDPFFGRTTIPAAPFGAGTPTTSDGYYPGPAPNVPGTGPVQNNNLYSPPSGAGTPQGSLETAPAAWENEPQLAGSVVPAKNGPDSPPPAAFAVQQTSYEAPIDVEAGADDVRQPPAKRLPNVGNETGPIVPASSAAEIRIVAPTPHSDPAAPDLREPRRGSASASAAIDIADLPPASSSGGRYGYDPEYRWLQGQLEYSQIDRSWKLRYIPIDGHTDRFGGSVVLDAPSLDDYQPGDFVTVEGAVAGGTSAGGFAPLYRTASIERAEL